MNNNFVSLVLIGAISYEQYQVEAAKLTLSSYEHITSKLQKKSTIKGKDWDDMLDTPTVFGTGSYSSEIPAGYTSAVDDVVKEQEKAADEKKAKEE